MRLIDIQTLTLQECPNEMVGQYAILSHRWQKEEILFEDMGDLSNCQKAGLAKMKGFCSLKEIQHLKYVWIDTCCIDKKSSAELSEAINSMYRYYAHSNVCIAFLYDVNVDTRHPKFEIQFKASVWFQRCWTLQELLAPQNLIFFNSRWEKLAHKNEIITLLSEATPIPVTALSGTSLSMYSIAKRMSWASTRFSTRAEDAAYSLMGIFDVNMPMLYGEGWRAFERLQEEILRYTDDETIFAWEAPLSYSVRGLLAPSPFFFRSCKNLKPTSLHPRTDTFVLTNRGLTGSLRVHELEYPEPTNTFLAFLNASFRERPDEERFVGIYLEGNRDKGEFSRLQRDPWRGSHVQIAAMNPQLTKINIRHRGEKLERDPILALGFDLSTIYHQEHHTLTGFIWNKKFMRCSDVELAPNVQWNPHPDRQKSIIGLGSGLICTFHLKIQAVDFANVMLGSNKIGEPVCFIWDTVSQALVAENFGCSIKHSTDLIESVDQNHGWTEFAPSQRGIDEFEGFLMRPGQPNKGMLALKGLVSSPTKWICLEPDLTTGMFKKRSSFVVTMKPASAEHQRLWQFHVEPMSKIVLYD